MKIVNLTPHEISIFNDDNVVVKTYPASGAVVRARSKSIPVGTVDDVPLVEFFFTAEDNLPEPADDTIYIVSTLAIQALPHPRYDVVAPDTTGDSAVRDADGRIIGVRRFQRPEW